VGCKRRNKGVPEAQRPQTARVAARRGEWRACGAGVFAARPRANMPQFVPKSCRHIMRHRRFFQPRAKSYRCCSESARQASGVRCAGVCAMVSSPRRLRARRYGRGEGGSRRRSVEWLLRTARPARLLEPYATLHSAPADAPICV